MNHNINKDSLSQSRNINQSSDQDKETVSNIKNFDLELVNFTNVSFSDEHFDEDSNVNIFDNKQLFSKNCNKIDQSMSHESPSYVNANSHDSAMIMKLLQQPKVNESNDVPTSNIRHNSDLSNNISDEYYWYYLDPRNNVQGPFHDSQMFQWWSQGIYFQNSLLMKRKADSEFSTLQDYSKRFNGVPFNRKDIRVPPLTESLSINHANHFMGSKLYTNSPMGTHANMHQNPPINDPSLLLQMFSNAPNTSADEVAKLLHKVNLQNRVPNQIEHMLTLPSMQNGSDQYMYNDVTSSLSSYVKPNFNNQYQHVQTECKPIPIENFTKNDRYPGPSWGSTPQAALMDTVWTSKDRIPTNHNTVWSQSNNDQVNNGPSLLSNIFQDSKPKLNSVQPDHLRNCNPMQDSWDNLDPAIIKMVPSIDHSVHVSTSTVHMELSASTQRTLPTDNTTGGMHSENAKSAWAEMVRKTNSASCQKYKSGCNSENELFTNHSVSPSQNKNSLTSTSSDEHENQQSESPDNDLKSLIIWTKNYLENKPGLSRVDISTLVELLSSVESPYEVDALIRENVPDFDNISDFVKMFLEKRRPLRLKIANDNQKKKSKSPPKIEENTKWQVKSRSHGSSKKKRKNNKN